MNKNVLYPIGLQLPKKKIEMRSETSKKIQSETPQQVRDEVRKHANDMVSGSVPEKSDYSWVGEKTKAELSKPVKYQANGQRQGFITFAAHLRAYGIYSMMFGTQQSADRLAERGGFGEAELDFFYPEWRNHRIQ